MHTGFSLSKQETGYSQEPGLNSDSYFMDINPQHYHYTGGQY